MSLSLHLPQSLSLRRREDINSGTTFLDRLSILFLNTTIVRVSRWASKGIKNVAANSRGKKKTWVSTGLNYEVCPALSTKQRTYATGWSEKLINTSSNPTNLLCNLITWPPEVEQALCLSHLISSSPLVQYWNSHCTDIYRIHSGSSQTVPVRDTGMIPTRCTAIHTSRLKTRVLD